MDLEWIEHNMDNLNSLQFNSEIPNILKSPILKPTNQIVDTIDYNLKMTKQDNIFDRPTNEIDNLNLNFTSFNYPRCNKSINNFNGLINGLDDMLQQNYQKWLKTTTQ